MPADAHERQRHIAELQQLVFNADVEREIALSRALTVQQRILLAVDSDSKR